MRTAPAWNAFNGVLSCKVRKMGFGSWRFKSQCNEYLIAYIQIEGPSIFFVKLLVESGSPIVGHTVIAEAPSAIFPSMRFAEKPVIDIHETGNRPFV